MSNDKKPFITDETIATGGDIEHPKALTPYQVKAMYEAEIQSREAKYREVLQKVADTMVQPIKMLSLAEIIYRSKECNKSKKMLNSLHDFLKSEYNIEPNKL